MNMTPEKATEIALRRLQRARSQMLIQRNENGKYPFVFWATAALHLKFRPIPGLKQMGGCEIATNAREIIFDPFVYAGDKFTEQQVMADVAHEVSHCVKGDLWRVGARDQRLFNVAGDMRIDPELIANGFVGPDHGSPAANAYFWNPRNKGRSAEELYEEVKADPPVFEPDGKEGDLREPGGPDPTDPTGGARTPQEAKEIIDTLKRDWEIISRQAAEIAHAQGTLPKGYEHLIAPVRPRTNPWDLIKYFVSMCRRDDYSFARPSRRSVWRDLYLPSLLSEGIGEVLVGIDTSGSCAIYIPSFLGFLACVLDEVKPDKTWLIECDAEVHKVTEFTAYDELPANVPVHGYGGTSMRPIWREAEKRSIEPTCAIILTDLEMTKQGFGPEQPFPVLWLTPCGGTAPWGETCPLETQ
jgi:predicted metal-dependent peptidase